MRAQTGRSVIAASGGKPCRMECVDDCPIGRGEGHVNSGQRRVTSPDPEEGLLGYQEFCHSVDNRQPGGNRQRGGLTE